MKLFVTGTDTDVGKTYVSVGILKALNQQGLSTLGIKPVASGCVAQGDKFYSQDALALQEASSIKLDYDKINPFAYEPPIAPHIAAKQVHEDLSVAQIRKKMQYLLKNLADVYLFEGVGGWYVPLNDQETMADFVKKAHLNVILVVGVRLGCINHALLTFKAMQKDKVNILGWVANCVDSNMQVCAENIATLQHWLPILCLGVISYQQRPEQVLDVAHFLK